MKPDGVGSGTPLVYSKFSPGLSTGCSPTTPAPRTSCRRPWASVMRQWRGLCWAGFGAGVVGGVVVGPQKKAVLGGGGSTLEIRGGLGSVFRGVGAEARVRT